LGRAYDSLKQHQRAVEYHQQPSPSDGKLVIAVATLPPGQSRQCLQFLGQYERAIKLHQQALDISQDVGDRRSEHIP
jgi:tetratricopeptide (TPR) repeat protein